jgi:tetratricopeptide (TPR) repeat protein
VLVIVGSGVYVLLGGNPRRDDPPPLLPVEVVTEASGARRASVDHEAWREAFAAVRLPPPPPIRDADPAPIERLAAAVHRWAAERQADAVGEIGSIYLALEEHPAALACFAAAAELDAAEPRWVYLLGAECEATGLDDTAIAALERAAALDPGYATTYARLGELRLLRGDLDGAEAGFQAFVDRDPGVSVGYTGLGRVAMARGDLRAAQRWLDTATRTTPNDFLAHRFLARALAAAGRTAEAEAATARARSLPEYSGWVTFDPRLQEAHALAGSQRHLENEARVALAEGRFAEGAALLQEILARRPDDHDTRGRLAAVYARLGQQREAREAIERAVSASPRSIALHRTAAELYMSMKLYDAASTAIERLLELDPASPRAHDLRGRLRYAAGDRAGAVADLERALELGAPEVDIRMALAVILAEAGQVPDAVAELDRILELRPDHPQARRLKTRLLSGG